MKKSSPWQQWASQPLRRRARLRLGRARLPPAGAGCATSHPRRCHRSRRRTRWWGPGRRRGARPRQRSPRPRGCPRRRSPAGTAQRDPSRAWRWPRPSAARRHRPTAPTRSARCWGTRRHRGTSPCPACRSRGGRSTGRCGEPSGCRPSRPWPASGRCSSRHRCRPGHAPCATPMPSGPRPALPSGWRSCACPWSRLRSGHRCPPPGWHCSVRSPRARTPQSGPGPGPASPHRTKSMET